MKNLYRVSIIYTGERPVHNHHSKDLPFVENGDIVLAFYVCARTAAEAYIDGNNEWKKTGDETAVFDDYPDAIYIKCDPVDWEMSA